MTLAQHAASIFEEAQAKVVEGELDRDDQIDFFIELQTLKEVEDHLMVLQGKQRTKDWLKRRTKSESGT
jgi:hypothetical protein